jgi:hypothetical protein
VLPGAHLLVVGSQHPPLHDCEALHACVHACVVWSQAYCAGQSWLVIQPHVPSTQWLLAPHAAQATPAVPHCVSDSVVTQFPFESQHPCAQLLGVHLSAH